MTDERLAWLHAQIDDDERWARALMVEVTAKQTLGPVDLATGAPAWTRTEIPDAGCWRAAPAGPAGFAARVDTGTRIRVAVEGFPENVTAEQVAEHISRHDPARVLREVEAKRRILAIHRRRADVAGEPGGAFDDCCHGCGYEVDDPIVEHVNACPERRALAAVYADRSGFQEMWGQQ